LPFHDPLAADAAEARAGLQSRELRLDPMRVLHLFNVFGATTERAMLDYTLALAERGWDLAAGYETLESSSRAGAIPLVHLRRIPVEPAADVPAQMDDVATAVTDPAMSDLLGQPFDLVHGHFGPRVLQAAAWLRRGTPVVISLYGYDVARLLRDPCWAERYRWAARRGATFVVLARYMRDRLLALGIPAGRVRLVRLGVHLPEHAFEPSPAERPARFVFVGRLVEKKGADVLVNAMARVARDTPGERVTLDLIGSGPRESELKRSVVEMNLGDRVRFLGTLPFHELFDHMRGAAALVQPSVVAPDGDSEGAPMVLMHAQAAGVPCVTTAHSGNPEVLPPEAQPFVVPERDAGALADAMRRIAALAPEERRSLQAAGRAWIEDHYDVERTVAGYDALYRELTAAAVREG
jgi:colanic acid/amylovoran biosynthesis glycosyltransferase